MTLPFITVAKGAPGGVYRRCINGGRRRCRGYGRCRRGGRRGRMSRRRGWRRGRQHGVVPAEDERDHILDLVVLQRAALLCRESRHQGPGNTPRYGPGQRILVKRDASEGRAYVTFTSRSVTNSAMRGKKLGPTLLRGPLELLAGRRLPSRFGCPVNRDENQDDQGQRQSNDDLSLQSLHLGRLG